MVSCPLLTPLTFLCADTSEMCSETGVTGARFRASGKFGTLSGPEVSLRDLPRMTVRGQTVQGVCLVLRRAPLRSKVCSWSTRRPCGPPAFRRATAGSRGAKEGLGESRGGKGTIRCPCPLLSPPPDGGNARSAHRQPSLASGGKPLYRQNRFPLLREKREIAFPSIF